jgi:DNA-binding NarL/FixJ family response regulator
MPPTVVLADDHPSVLTKIRTVLADQIKVVATVNDGFSPVQAVEEFSPDILILDISMPGQDGIHVAREVKRLGLKAKLIFITVQEDPDYVEVARTLGASYVLKSRLHIDLPLAIKDELAGRIFISPFSLLSSSLD